MAAFVSVTDSLLYSLGCLERSARMSTVGLSSEKYSPLSSAGQGARELAIISPVSCRRAGKSVSFPVDSHIPSILRWLISLSNPRLIDVEP